MYTRTTMTHILATAEWPPSPRTPDAKKAAFVYAFLLVVMTAAQLFSLEKFIPLLDSMELPLGGRFWAVLLVVCGVLALPFLLRMKLSVAMRWVSMVAGWVVPAAWLLLAVWVNVVGGVDNIGFLGASVRLIPGWWAVCVVAGLGILAAWASWGLWPGKRTPHLERRRKK